MLYVGAGVGVSSAVIIAFLLYKKRGIKARKKK